MVSDEYSKRISEGPGAIRARNGDLITDQDHRTFQIIEVKEATRRDGSIASMISGSMILESVAWTTLSIFCKTCHEELVLQFIDQKGRGTYRVKRLEDEDHDDKA